MTAESATTVQALSTALAAFARGTPTAEDGEVLQRTGARRLGERNTNDVWFATVNGVEVCVKVFVGQQDDGAAREWVGLHHFAALTPSQVPTPLHFDAFGVVAMTALEGTPLADQVLTDDQVDAIGRWFVTATTADAVADLPLARTAPVALVPRTRRNWAHLTSRVEVDDPIVRSAIDGASRWLETDDLDRLLELSPIWLCRGDSNLANCLWNGQRVAMIDFEDAGWNHPVVQLGDGMEHLRAHRNPERTWSRLLAAVAEADIDFSLLTTVRRRFAIYWLAHLLPGGRAADRNPPDTLERQAARVLDLLHPG